jgi:hypothetical protein
VPGRTPRGGRSEHTRAFLIDMQRAYTAPYTSQTHTKNVARDSQIAVTDAGIPYGEPADQDR